MGNLLYDIDEGIIQTINNNTQKKSDVKDRVQFPMRDSSSSTSTSDIPKNTSPISYNNNSTNQTQSQIASLPLNNMQNNQNNIQNPLQISQLTPEDANTTPTLPNVNRNRINDGESRFYSNIRDKTNMLNEQQKNIILSNEEVRYYDKVTNEESLNKAFSRLNEGGEAETRSWFYRHTRDENGKMKSNVSSVDVAEGYILMKQYADNGDYDSMVAVVKTRWKND